MSKRIYITESQLKCIMKEMMNPEKEFTVYVMCGIPGSGKSTWASNNHPDLPIVSRDIIRAELGYTSGVDEKAVLTREQEEEVTVEENRIIANYCKNRHSFIIDDTNSHPKFRKILLDTLRSYGAHIVGVNMDTPLDMCIKRRNGQIPPEAIERMYGRRVPFEDSDVDELVSAKGY